MMKKVYAGTYMLNDGSLVTINKIGIAIFYPNFKYWKKPKNKISHTYKLKSFISAVKIFININKFCKL